MRNSYLKSLMYEPKRNLFNTEEYRMPLPTNKHNIIINTDIITPTKKSNKILDTSLRQLLKIGNGNKKK